MSDWTGEADELHGPSSFIWVNTHKLYADQVQIGTRQSDDRGAHWVSGREDNQAVTWRRTEPEPRYMIELKGGDAGTADGPGEPGYIKISPVHPDQTPEDLLEEIVNTPMNPDGSVTLRAPATDTGRVDFRELLRDSHEWKLRDRLNTVLGRPYLSTQLVSMLPADVCLRLAERLDHLVEERVRHEVEQIHSDVDNAVTTTLARLAAAADTKRKELTRERFSGSSRLG